MTWVPSLNHLNVVVLLLSAMRVQACNCKKAEVAGFHDKFSPSHV